MAEFFKKALQDMKEIPNAAANSGEYENVNISYVLLPLDFFRFTALT